MHWIIIELANSTDIHADLSEAGTQQVQRNPASFTEELKALKCCLILPPVFFFECAFPPLTYVEQINPRPYVSVIKLETQNVN